MKIFIRKKTQIIVHHIVLVVENDSASVQESRILDSVIPMEQLVFVKVCLEYISSTKRAQKFCSFVHDLLYHTV